jgi:hypothetical protein
MNLQGRTFGTTVWLYVLPHAIHGITEAGRLKLSHSVYAAVCPGLDIPYMI